MYIFLLIQVFHGMCAMYKSVDISHLISCLPGFGSRPHITHTDQCPLFQTGVLWERLWWKWYCFNFFSVTRRYRSDVSYSLSYLLSLADLTDVIFSFRYINIDILNDNIWGGWWGFGTARIAEISVFFLKSLLYHVWYISNAFLIFQNNISGIP